MLIIRDGPCAYSAIKNLTGCGRAIFSQHIQVLERAGVVKTSLTLNEKRRGKWKTIELINRDTVYDLMVVASHLEAQILLSKNS